MDPVMSEKTGNNFISFSTAFFNFGKKMYRHEKQIRANSLAFQAMMELNNRPQNDRYLTMSELADVLQITKQQLTKLVNDLEEKQLVERIHGTSNRRQVYICITPPGHELLENLHIEMLDTIIRQLSALSDEELCRLNQALEVLLPLLEKISAARG